MKSSVTGNSIARARSTMNISAPFSTPTSSSESLSAYSSVSLRPRRATSSRISSSVTRMWSISSRRLPTMVSSMLPNTIALSFPSAERDHQRPPGLRPHKRAAGSPAALPGHPEYLSCTFGKGNHGDVIAYPRRDFSINHQVLQALPSPHPHRPDKVPFPPRPHNHRPNRLQRVPIEHPHQLPGLLPIFGGHLLPTSYCRRPTPGCLPRRGLHHPPLLQLNTAPCRYLLNHP